MTQIYDGFEIGRQEKENISLMPGASACRIPFLMLFCSESRGDRQHFHLWRHHAYLERTKGTEGDTPQSRG